MKVFDSEETARALRLSGKHIGLIASFAEKGEHLESRRHFNNEKSIRTIRDVGSYLLLNQGIEPVEAFITKTRSNERKHFYTKIGIGIDTVEHADPVRISWRGLQAVQAEHDRHFHPDVIGNGKRYDLQHTLLHLSNVNGSLAYSLDDGTWEQVSEKRLPDMLIFAVKLANALMIKLEDHPVTKLDYASVLAN